MKKSIFNAEAAIIFVCAFFSLISLVLMSGCASLPKETYLMSSEMGGLIQQGKGHHMILVDEYVEVRTANIDLVLEHAWIPSYLAGFAKRINFQKSVCGEKGELDRAKKLQKFVTIASKAIYQKRIAMLNKLAEAEGILRESVREHYARLENINHAITSNLHSVIKLKEMRKEILKALNVPSEKILPFEKASEKLDEMLMEVSP